MRNLILTTLFLFLGILTSIDAQVLNGFVQDENNVPVPFVSVYVKFVGIQTETDADGRYSLLLDPGDYEIVFDLTGFQQKTIQVFVTQGQKDMVKNVWLQNAVELDEVVIKRKRRDPAYEIIASAVKHKKENEFQYSSSRTEVYIKAKEIITDQEKKRREKEKEKIKKEDKTKDDEPEKVDAQNYDPFEEERKKKIQKLANSMNLVEAQITKNFQFPNKIKEVKTAYKKYGSDEGLYYLSTTEGDMNWYNGLVNAPTLSENPFISPLNASSVLSYKFKLEEQSMDEKNRFVYKIKITPRKKGNTTVSGYIWIIDKTFNIKKIDLHLPKGGLLFYDAFRVQQEYNELNDSLWVITDQQFDYQTKMGRQNFIGNTVLTYQDIELNVVYPKRYFNNEVGLVTEEAMERVSSYWSKLRPAPLTKEEQRIIAIKDSIYAVYHSKEFLDSIDREYNKLTFGKVVWHGVGFRNREKKKHLEFGSLADLTEPFAIGGMRIGPYFWFFKKWENEKALIINPDISIGLRNQDVKGDFSMSFLYNPVKQSKVSISVGREFDMFTYNDGILSMFNRGNWVDQYYANFEFRTELFNGFYMNLSANYLERSPLTDYEFGSISEDFVQDNVPLDFEKNQAVIAEFSFHYTPFQKYIREPKRKVVLGSKWPTFSAYIEHGFKDILGSDVDFTYITARIKHTFKVRSIGTSTYMLKAGKFINQNKLTYTDEKIFPKGDRIFFSSPLWSFQLQDTALTVRGLYLEAHYIHHFNGALINNIPLLKKTGISLAAGGGALYIKEQGYLYKEAFAGVEKSFRIRRQRFRIGMYGVLGDSNLGKATPAIKWSISMYSVREKKWGF
ncbi:MAG: carboxypeptidase-like regulatory domain-containing protein [Flavobacteriales bacterium]|nr:carboxypeptidase-like regulatory domain-containing protein [Flavobacteriales bacterium]